MYFKIWKSPPIHPQTKRITKKVNDNCYIELMHLLKILVLLTCQILPFKFGKLSLRKKKLMIKA